MNFRFRKIAIGVLLSLLFACNTPDPTPVTSVTKTIDAAGGNLEVMAEGGAKLRLEFPVNATREARVVKLVAKSPPAGSFARFEINPAGSRWNATITLKLSVPTNVAITDKTVMFFRSGTKNVPLPTIFDMASKTFTVYSRMLGLENLVSTQVRQDTGLFDGVELANINCQTELDFLGDAILRSDAWITGFASDTKSLMDRFATLKAICKDLDNVQLQIDLIQARACDDLKSAVLSGQVLLVESIADLETIAKKLLNTKAMVEIAGAECVTDADPGGVLNDKFKQFTDLYNNKINQADFTTKHTELWRELKNTVGKLADCELLSLHTEVCSMLEATIATLFDKQRAAAYKHCQTEGSQYFLLNLAQAGALIREVIQTSTIQPRALPNVSDTIKFKANFGAIQLEQDIQYCASKLELSLVGPTAVIGKFGRTLGGDAPDKFQPTALTQSPVVGELQLKGSIKAFDCNTGFSNDELIIKLNDIEIKRVLHSGGNYLAAPIKISLLDTDGLLTGSDLERAGIDPTIKATYPLQVFRHGEACAGIYSDADFKLFEIKIEFQPRPKIISASLSPTTLNASADFITQTFTLEFLPKDSPLLSVRNLAQLLPNGGSFSDVRLAKDITVDNTNGKAIFNAQVRVRCSEIGKGTKRNTFLLTDEFGQTSNEKSADTSVNYSNCP